MRRVMNSSMALILTLLVGCLITGCGSSEQQQTEVKQATQPQQTQAQQAALKQTPNQQKEFQQSSQKMPQPAEASGKKPNILVIWGDDIGWQNVSAYGMGTMGYTTPNIDRTGLEGIRFTDHYAQPSCTAGRAAFFTG